eukprot:gene30944-36000_t
MHPFLPPPTYIPRSCPHPIKRSHSPPLAATPPLAVTTLAQFRTDVKVIPDQSGNQLVVARPMQLSEKLVTLACAITVDYDYFSQHSSNSHGMFGMGMGMPMPIPVPMPGGGASEGGGTEGGSAAGAGAPPPPPPAGGEQDFGGDGGSGSAAPPPPSGRDSGFGGDDQEITWDDGKSGGGDGGGVPIMLSANTRALRGKVSSANATKAAPQVRCNAATAWSAWDKYMVEKKKPLLTPTASEAKISEEIGSSLKKIAVSYKPHYAEAMKSVDSGSFKVAHVDITPVELPAGLHEKLEAIGAKLLLDSLGGGIELDTASASYSTTDVNGALCITGCTVVQDGAKVAHVSLVATETERQASWSRLEGLLLHWGCSESAGSPWVGAPSGWTCIPDKKIDAGGAQECMFQKSSAPGTQEKLYTMILQLPLKGSLRSGGVTFVLKATDTQNTKGNFFVRIWQLLPGHKM